MVNIYIQIDSNQVTVNQSETPTKVENKATSANKTYFIVMCHYDESSWVELVTEDYKEAMFVRDQLEKKDTFCREYKILVQKQGSITPCNGADWDVDK